MRYTSVLGKDDAHWSAWIVSAAFVAPVALSAGSFGSKPVDLTFADVWLLAFILFALLRAFLVKAPFIVASRKVITIALIPILYFSMLGIIGGILNQNPLSNIVSAARFTKPFIFIIIGWQIFNIYRHAVVRPFFVTCFMMQAIVISSDLIWGNFPLGCGIESRWGGCFFQGEVYGFPNSSASFQVMLTGLMIGMAYLMPKTKIMLVFIIPMGAVLAMLSLSRAAWIYFFWLLICFWWLLLNDRQKIFSAVSIAFLIFVALGPVMSVDFDLLAGILSKIERSTGDDPSSGRFSIWMDAIDLISANPIFGYRFDYFSDYVIDFDTPHNQYLEIAFKSGLIGLMLYVCIIIVLWRCISPRKINADRRVLSFFKWGVLAGLMLNGIFQPIFSYSIVSNLVMLLVGYALAGINPMNFGQQNESTLAEPR